MRVIKVVSELPEEIDDISDEMYALVGVTTTTNDEGKVTTKVDTGYYVKETRQKQLDEGNLFIKKNSPKDGPFHYTIHHLNPDFPSFFNKSTMWKELPQLKKLPLVDGTVMEFENATYTWAARYFYLSDRPGQVFTFTTIAKMIPDPTGADDLEYEIGKTYKASDLKDSVSNLSHCEIDGCLIIPGKALMKRKSSTEFLCMDPDEFGTFNKYWVIKATPNQYTDINSAPNPMKKIEKKKGALSETFKEIMDRMSPRDRISVWTKNNFFLLRLTASGDLIQSPFALDVTPPLPTLVKIEVEDDYFKNLVKDLVVSADTFELDGVDGMNLIVFTKTGEVSAWVLNGKNFYLNESTN